MLIVDKEKCIACNKCISDCFAGDIEIVEGKAFIKNDKCFQCGHCIAVCPKNAVSTDEYNMEDVKEYNKEEFSLNADNLLNFIRFRRSTRQFLNKEIESEKLEKILSAGRFTQTASNSQNVSYVVVREKLDELRDMTLATLSAAGKHILDTLNDENRMYEKYAHMWIAMYDAYKQDKKNDKLFFEAPLVIVVVSDSDVNASLASSNMELVTNALGLGTFFSGFLVNAAKNNPDIKKLLGLQEQQHISTCMVIGYPKIKYKRTAPRKDATILWR